MSWRIQLGQQAEHRVKEWYLGRRGAHFLAQNYRFRGGELDLVVQEPSTTSGNWVLVFVEVRVRIEPGWVSGLESVGFKKQMCLRRTASRFMAQYRGLAQEVRFDLICWNGQHWQYYPGVM